MTWPGQAVQQVLGIGIPDEQQRAFRELAGLALRLNPRRAHLIVSTVLAKHIPVSPSLARSRAAALGAQVLPILDGRVAAVIGFAETATALGFDVAEALPGSWYLHSTRSPGPDPLVGFSEEHSHATAHFLDPTDPGQLRNAEVVVLVDDELSTGQTALNTIASLLAHTSCRQFVVASLIDSRMLSDRERNANEAEALGISLMATSLLALTLDVPAGSAAVGVQHAERIGTASATVGEPGGSLATISTALVASGARGMLHGDRRALAESCVRVAGDVADAISDGTGTVVVVGTEEFMTPPMLVGEALEAAGHTVLCSSTTRSPVVVVDDAGYAVRSALVFGASATTRYAYNLPNDARAIVLVTLAPARHDLVAALSTLAPVVVVEFADE